MSPYEGKNTGEWLEITENLIGSHPLAPNIVDFCLKSWESILNGKINTYLNLRIGKSKSGYYLAINFDKLSESNPKIRLIRMGWLDHTDWQAQKSETGQQASLTKAARDGKLLTLYSSEK